MIQLYLWYSGELSDNENGYIWIIFKLFLMLRIIDTYLSQLYKSSPNGSCCTSSCCDIQLMTVQWRFNYENIAEDSNITNNTVHGIFKPNLPLWPRELWTEKINISASAVVIEYWYFARRVFRVDLGDSQFPLHFWVSISVTSYPLFT